MARCESCGRRVRGVAVRDLGSRSALMCRACLGALVRAFLAARLACFFAGHRWVAVKVHNPLLAHLHPTAGVDARCTRCGSVSMWGGQRYDEES